MADLAQSMREVPNPSPSEELRAGVRALLIAKIEREGIGATAVEKTAARSALDGKTQVIRQVRCPGVQGVL